MEEAGGVGAMTRGDHGSMLAGLEEGLNPADLTASPIPVKVLGYGEISAVLQVGDDTRHAYKRMPLFRTRAAAEDYAGIYREYCDILTRAGLAIPPSDLHIVEHPGRPVILYIVQEQLPPRRFAHKMILELERSEIGPLIEQVVGAIGRVWAFNREQAPRLQVGLDGQLSNWVLSDGGLRYIDTSTPLYRRDGVEQIDPELFLRSAPFFLRWILRWFFLKDVVSRYYDQRLVLIDLAANLFKEQRPDLVPLAIEVINDSASGFGPRLSAREVEKYYGSDKLVWTLYLAFRKVDRWLRVKLARGRYEFVLPDEIKR